MRLAAEVKRGFNIIIEKRENVKIIDIIFDYERPPDYQRKYNSVLSILCPTSLIYLVILNQICQR